MDHFIDIYKKKPEICEELLSQKNIKINLKVDGKPFQVLFNDETNELEFHGRSGDETHVGPLIDDYTRLFSKPVNDAIAHVEKHVDVFKKYKFLTFEVIDKLLLLTAIVDKKMKFIESADEIKKIADELDTDVMPTLWEGELTQEQKDSIINILMTGIVPEKKEFIDWVTSMFGSYKSFPKKLISASDEFIEGIVFFFPVGEKVVEYKLVDPTYRQSMKDRDAENEKERQDNAKYYEIIYNTFVEYLESIDIKKNDNRILNLQKLFLQMMQDKKIYNKLFNAGSHVKINTSKTYALQNNRVIPELSKAFQKNGDVYKQLCELFIKLFYKGKKRGFVISQEFQQRVNALVEKI